MTVGAPSFNRGAATHDARCSELYEHERHNHCVTEDSRIESQTLLAEAEAGDYLGLAKVLSAFVVAVEHESSHHYLPDVVVPDSVPSILRNVETMRRLLVGRTVETPPRGSRRSGLRLLRR